VELFQAHRPGIEKDSQHIEDHKEKGIKIIAEVKLNPGPAEGLQAALVGRAFDRIGFLGADAEKAEDKGEKG
jgi:hypothetical protein